MQLEKAFRILWADHGDALSWQYAGTGALKSGFTRTGVRSPMGLLDDGWKSAIRYYLNNYEDGHKQDAIDLITGNYRPLHVRPLLIYVLCLCAVRCCSVMYCTCWVCLV